MLAVIPPLSDLKAEVDRKKVAEERARRTKGIIPEPGPPLPHGTWSPESQTLAKLSQRAAITNSFREARQRRSWIGKLKSSAKKQPKKPKSAPVVWTGLELNLASPICQDI